MSTQHPDNAHPPFFSDTTVIEGDAEIKEAYYVFSHLGCTEQMWDYEGKEVDAFVVKKLISRYGNFFAKHPLGEEVFLTLRVPNPGVEASEGKILLETLESIPRSFDIAKIFYRRDIAPIFEVILPMTRSALQLNRIHSYYKNVVVGKQTTRLVEGDVTLADWIGEFKPEEINVIPLVEDKEGLLYVDRLVEAYVKGKRLEYQRVFLARSDPALNYGMVGAVILNKIAAVKLWELEKKLSLPILPIIGKGAAPFRGNLAPNRTEELLRDYPSIQTFTIQSAFKYDYPEKQVQAAVAKLNEGKRTRPLDVDFEAAMEIFDRYSFEYERQVIQLAPLINEVAPFVPARRKRKLHIGLFGYSRGVGKSRLPRAITFCAALYSLGLPPELLALNSLNQKDKETLLSFYPKFETDLADAGKLLNEKNFRELVPEADSILANFRDIEVNEEHRQTTDFALEHLKAKNLTALEEDILHAARLRGFLG